MQNTSSESTNSSLNLYNGMDVELPLDVFDYTLRRYYVDLFHFRHIPFLDSGSLVLDLGGNKIRKRGEFDIEKYDLSVTYANLTTEKKPDIQADASYIPIDGDYFDVIICSELLEHVPNPPSVVEEAFRVLRPGGVLFICIPFLYQIHGDPYDFGRYTDHYWSTVLGNAGFCEIAIEKQGLFWSVIAGFLTGWINMLDQKKPLRRRFRWIMLRSVTWVKQTAVKWDRSEKHKNHPFFSSFTTGFGICAQKWDSM